MQRTLKVSTGLLLNTFILFGFATGFSAQQPPANLEETQRDAAGGSAESQYQLARLYASGSGVPKDDAQAAKLYQAAAEQGYMRAQLALGNAYFNGQGLTQNYAAAMEWYRKAAAQGSAAAQYNIGQLYFKGSSVRKDYAEAVAWYRKAAGQGYLAAQFNLALMYWNGKGTQKNALEAYVWLNLAAAHAKGDQEKEFAAARDRVARRLSQAQLAEGQRLASEWKPTRAAQ